MLSREKLQYLSAIARKKASKDELEEGCVSPPGWHEMYQEMDKMNLEELNQLDEAISLTNEDCLAPTDYSSHFCALVAMHKNKLFIDECCKRREFSNGVVWQLHVLMRKSFPCMWFLELFIHDLHQQITKMEKTSFINDPAVPVLKIMERFAETAHTNGKWE